MADTDIYQWPMPTPGGSAGTWGVELNALFDEHIEETVKAVEDKADARLPLTGGAVTGPLDVAATTGSAQSLGTISGSVTINLSQSDFFHGVYTGATTFTFTNWPADRAKFVVLELRRSGGGASVQLTWPSALRWDGGVTPTLDNGRVGVFVLYSRNGGQSIRGVKVYDGAL